MVYFKFLEPAIFQLSKEYDKREKAIKSCVGVLSQKVNSLRKEREENMDDFDLMRKLRKEQTKVNIFMNSSFNSYGMRTDFYIICCNGLGCFCILFQEKNSHYQYPFLSTGWIQNMLRPHL